MTDYSTLSDAEINAKLAKAIQYDHAYLCDVREPRKKDG